MLFTLVKRAHSHELFNGDKIGQQHFQSTIMPFSQDSRKKISPGVSLSFNIYYASSKVSTSHVYNPITVMELVRLVL